MEVSLYIEANIKDKQGTCAYVLEYIGNNGGVYTRSRKATYYDITAYSLHLHALISALERITRRCTIKIYMDCDSASNVIKSGLIDTWARNNWTKPSGRSIEYIELWLELYDLVKRHTLEFAKDKHSYKNWLIKELEIPTANIVKGEKNG